MGPRWKPVALVIEPRLKRALLLLLAVVLVAGVAAVSHEPVTRVLSRTGNTFLDQPKAAWVWDSALIAPSTASTTGRGTQAFIDSLRQMNINRVFLNVGWEKATKEAYLRSQSDAVTVFLKQAHARGITVDALYGEPTWARAESLPLLEQYVKLVLEYNATHKYRFNALHLDIEPYGCPGYGGQRDLILKEYLANLTRVRELVTAHNKAARDDLQLVLDLPAWWTETEPTVDGGALVPQLIALADEIVVMDYTEEQARFADQARAWLKLGQAGGKKVMIGVDFQANDRPKSLAVMTRDELQAFFQEPLTEFSRTKLFTGLAVHHYSAYREFCASLR